MTLPETTALTLACDGGVLHATLDRPEAGNALNAELVDDLFNTFAAIRDDRSVRAVVLRGAGRHFCVGADLREVGGLAGDNPPGRDETAAHNRRFGELLAAIDSAPQAVIVFAQGTALGGGFGLLCVADITLVVSDARMGMPEARRGLPAAQILPFVVARIGAAEARRLSVCGLQFAGDEATRLGIAHHVVDNAKAGEVQIARILDDVLACAPGAVAASKAVIHNARTHDRSAQLDAGAAAFTDCLFGDEGREGIRAFLDKRAPYWDKT